MKAEAAASVGVGQRLGKSGVEIEPGAGSGTRVPGAGAGGRADLRAHKKGPRKAEPADLAAAVQLDPAADVTTLAARLGVSRPTVYAWADALGLARDDAGHWTAVQSN